MKRETKYDIALSFAGEDRPYVEKVAEILKQREINVFYDSFEEANLWGKDLYVYLSDIYQNQAQYTIMFISESYNNKLWTNHERQSMQARAFQESTEYILPARFDNTIVPGLSQTIGYIDLRTTSPEKLADIIQKKLAFTNDTNSKNDITNYEPRKEKINTKLIFETKTLSVPATGGEYQIKINAKIPFSFDPISGSISQTNAVANSSFNNLFGPIGTIAYSKELTDDNNIKIKVNPASSHLMDTTQINIYSSDGKCNDCLTIIQEGNDSKSIKITSDGIPIINSICSNLLKSFSTMYTMEAFYTQCWNHSYQSYYDHKLSPYDDSIKQLFNQCYLAIRPLHTVEEHYDDIIIRSAFSCIEALFYYQMVILWGNVPYMASTSSGNSITSKQMKSKELFAIFKNDLLYCINAFSKAKTGNKKAIDMIFPSRDVPCMILARIYMYMNEYAKALPLLESIIDSNNYSLEPNRLASMKENSKELIYSFLLSESTDNIFKSTIEANDTLPILSYTEVLLCAAECEYHLGFGSKAIIYLNKVNQAKGLALANDSDLLINLQDTWKSELKGTGTFFPFLKRNNLAERILNIKSYQLLFPFPINVIMSNCTMVQNTGY